MYHDQSEIYCWEGLKSDIAEFIAKYLNCQQVKAEHQKSGGVLQVIQIPSLKWDYINMDFVVGLPRTKKSYDSIWVVLDRLTKSTSFIPVKSLYSAEDYERIFLDEIVCLHGIRISIISDQGT